MDCVSVCVDLGDHVVQLLEADGPWRASTSNPHLKTNPTDLKLGLQAIEHGIQQLVQRIKGGATAGLDKRRQAVRFVYARGVDVWSCTQLHYYYTPRRRSYSALQPPNSPLDRSVLLYNVPLAQE